jgi:hypothetical protein
MMDLTLRGKGVMLKSELKPLAPPRQKLNVDPTLAAAAGGVVGVGVAVATHLVSQWVYERYAVRKRKGNNLRRIRGQVYDFEVETLEEMLIRRKKQYRIVLKDKL